MKFKNTQRADHVCQESFLACSLRWVSDPANPPGLVTTWGPARAVQRLVTKRGFQMVPGVPGSKVPNMTKSQTLHGTAYIYIYAHILTQNHPNVGIYSIHGVSGK